MLKHKQNIKVVLNHRVGTIKETESLVNVDGLYFDWLVSCTYNTLKLPFSVDQVACYYKVCLSLVYRTVSGGPAMAINVMDGTSNLFTSLFP